MTRKTKVRKRSRDTPVRPYASSSSSLSQSYDVFMSFRGEDTRTGFTSHLYDALTRKHIRTYKDDKSLEIGNFIAPELLEAIEASRFAVVVLSSNFATSKWCLEEITRVVDCLERGKLIVIPVFYHVDPSDVRHQCGSFKQGFAIHEANPEITPQKVKTWRAAFARVGDISGLHITPHRNESETVSEIVRKILKGMQVTLPTAFTDGLVGIDSRVHEVKRIMIMESSDVRFIGICGMSGMGKTTLAEVVYKGVQNNFQGSCFIENIKDVSKKNDSTNLCKLQEKLLDDILKDNIHVESVTQGQTLLGTMLRGLKVIIVLDDVNHVDQLTFLAGSREWFGPGSRILVTTTNNDLLVSHIVDEIYTCEEMKDDEALRLFSQSAFKKGHPTHGYEKLSDDIVKLAGGLPLALNVYGSVLCGKEENYWKDMLEKLREYAHEEVLGRLETVYVRLDRIQRNTFIYIACFLKGKDINLVKDILTNLRLYPECGISDLINKFLIIINPDDSVWVHDLLQQMCWEVLRKESERHDGKHIAIKLRQNVEDIFSLEPEGTRSVEIINQEPYEVEGDDFFDDHNCLSKMIKLKFLRISKIDFHQGLHRLSNELRILEWYGCSLKSLPTTFKPQHIFELEMCYSQLQSLWEKALDLPNLRSINLSFSKDLTKIPDLTSTSNLVKLNLEGCTNLTELHESVLLQKSLCYMNLKGCTRLRNLGAGTMEMEALEALLLSGCSNLEYLPEFGQNMKRLEHLFVDGTSIKKLPGNLGNMFNLKKLDVSETAIKEIPLSVHYLKRLRLLRAHICPLSPPNRGFPFTNVNMLSSGLRELDLSYCNLSVVPDGIGLLHRLINLDLSGNDFVYLPASISLLSNLRMLCLNNCKRLESLPKLSVVNEDTIYGLQIRYNYYISREGVDVSKFDATGSNTSPMVSCLNCPKLVENESGSCLTERILNSYLQLRTKYWITPEAVFEIVGAGSKIPSGFKLLKSDENVLLEGPWVGVAICAVINACQTDAYMEFKYVVTVYIHVGEKCWPISVPVNLLLARLENHLVFFWTIADDLQRMVDLKQRNNFSFSFSVQPGDGNLQVTKFGVRFIRDEDILQLKRRKSSTSKELHSLFHATVTLPTDLQWYIHACEADKDLHSCHSNIQDLTSWMIQFILDYGKQQDSLDGVHKILKCLIEINQQVLSECMEELKDSQLFPLIYDFYRICHGTSQLYNDFLRLLKDVSYTWMSVKLALEQVVLKSSSDDYIYKETLQQLNDLEAAEGVRFSDDFITSFAYICKQTIAFSRHFSKEIQDNKKFKLVMTLAKVSSIMIACIFIIVATFIGDYKLLQEMKDNDSYSMWLHIIQGFTSKLFGETYLMMRSFDRGLRISYFYGNAILLQDLKKKMAQSISITKENEGDVMAVIGKLETKIVNFSKTIENMSHQAYKYSHDIREARINLNQVIADNNLHIRFCLIPGEDILQWKRHEDLKSKGTNIPAAAAASMDLIQETQFRWLRPGEVLFILQNYEESQLNHEPPQKPPSGSLFLFNKRVLRFFRKDGHSWRRKKDGRNVGEAHERLKVGNVEALNCYYAHGEENPNFQRRCYWMLDSAMEHIVLVHYRDITIGKHGAGPISALSYGSSNIIQSSNSYTTLSAAANEFDETYISTSGPSFIEIGPDVVTNSNGESRLNLTDITDNIDGSPDIEIDQALRRLEEQLSLDHVKDIGTFYSQNEFTNDLGFTINEQHYSESEGLLYGSDDYVSLQYPVLDKAQEQLSTFGNGATDYGRLHQYQQLPNDEFTIPNQQTLIWKDVLKYNGNEAYDGSLENCVFPPDNNELLLPRPHREPVEEHGKHFSRNTDASNESCILLSQELEDSTFPKRNMYQSDVDVYSTLFDQGQIATRLASDSSLTIAQDQKFIIREISPEWVYATEPTKVLIVGTFTCDASNNEWICMFGDIEVPVEIIQEGVICCHAPPRSPGKVTICITSGNREACSEVREFEYRDKPNIYTHNTNLTENESSRSSEELLLLVKFVQMLLSDKIGQKESSMAGDDSWAQVIESLSDGGPESSRTTDWLLDELLKDKLQQWISFKLQDNNDLPVLSKREQGIIHMVSGLGFAWALAPILQSGVQVGINFRDVNGWTALHWAARFGREKMIAELIASGAYAGAVTDPCQQDPTGKTPASIASIYGHKGLAGYLSEVALTTHLSSLTLQESELSKCSADVEAERTVNSILNPNFVNESRLSFKDALKAVRNATQAASRIQSAFRAHSFKKKKQKEAAEYSSADEYGILSSDIEGLSAASKLVFGNARDHNAALSIQKRYRGYKDRKDFLTLRQKVVKIQAHVRGHQARKNYEIICWAVGIIDKAILRWYRKGVGLRGFHLDSIDDNVDEDIMKVFRKQKVDVALSEAVSRVLSMVNSTPARRQYRRMLQKYQQAKAERGGLESVGSSTSQLDTAGMETEDWYAFV